MHDFGGQKQAAWLEHYQLGITGHLAEFCCNILSSVALATQESIIDEEQVEEGSGSQSLLGLPPPFKATLSSPNILNGGQADDRGTTELADEAASGDSGSDVGALLEEDLTGYCEPFLPALPPPPPLPENR